METTESRLGQYRTLIVLLAIVWSASAALITSCGGGGSDSANGELCDQCGSAPEFTDPPCNPTQFLSGGPPAAVLCNDGQSCTVALTCLRKQDDAQRRCFPSTENGELATTFECDDARPGGTLTPRPTRTPTVTPSGASASPGCGNDTVEGTEECDGTDLSDEDCDTLCEADDPFLDVTGILRCNSNCTFNFTGCINAINCQP